MPVSVVIHLFYIVHNLPMRASERYVEFGFLFALLPGSSEVLRSNMDSRFPDPSLPVCLHVHKTIPKHASNSIQFSMSPLIYLSLRLWAQPTPYCKDFSSHGEWGQNNAWLIFIAALIWKVRQWSWKSDPNVHIVCVCVCVSFEVSKLSLREIPSLMIQMLPVCISTSISATSIEQTLALTVSQTWALLFSAVQQHARTFARVLRDVHTKLDDVAREDLAGRTLLRAPTQSLAVNKGAIAAFCILQVELTGKKGQN